MILTEIGEIGVHYNNGRDCIILRPSLYAMSQIGTPAEIVETYAVIMSDPITIKDQWNRFRDALHVINCCSAEDIDHVFGYFNERLKFVHKLVPMQDIVTLAQSLMRHGITGAQKPLPRKPDTESQYTNEFNAQEHVAVAMAHLGLSEREAWDMTMTGLIGALRAKFPPTKEQESAQSAPTPQEHDETMAWFEEINAARIAKAEREKAAGIA